MEGMGRGPAPSLMQALSGPMGFVRVVGWGTGRIFHLLPAPKGRREQSEPTTLGDSISRCLASRIHPAGPTDRSCPESDCWVSRASRSLCFFHLFLVLPKGIIKYHLPLPQLCSAAKGRSGCGEATRQGMGGNSGQGGSVPDGGKLKGKFGDLFAWKRIESSILGKKV